MLYSGTHMAIVGVKGLTKTCCEHVTCLCVFSVKDLLMNVGDQFSKDEVSTLWRHADS